MLELRAKGQDVTFDEILSNVKQRDFIDENRAESPLRRAEDAIDFDNSNMSIEEQDKALLNLFYNKVNK